MKKIILLIVIVLISCGSTKFGDNEKMTVKKITQSTVVNECKYTIDMGYFAAHDLIIYTKDCGLFKVGDQVKLVKE